MLRSFGAAISLIAAFAVVPALASEKESSAEQVVSTETKTETSSTSAPATPLPAAADGTERTADDPFVTALKARLSQAARGERAALATFYESRQYKPLWVTPAGLSASAEQIIAEIRAADDWGLKASDFAVPSLAATAGDAERAAAEVDLGLAVLKYARFARGGRIDPRSLTKFLDRSPPVLEPQAVLDQIAAAPDASVWLRGQHPQHPQFERLRQKYLSMARSRAVADVAKVPKGPVLELGARHADVALVRARLGVAATGENDVYDEPLEQKVIAFQTERGLKVRNGKIDAPTRQALNSIEFGSTRRILANMEQWRWMPDQLGSYYVWVNIPDFMIRVVENGKVIHAERIVVGKSDTQTPIFSDQMEQIIFHPFWGVPDSIKRNELQPNLAAGGAILARQGLKVQHRGRDIDPSSVDWQTADMRNFHIYQPPGPSNVLGVVKFRFPNKHDVYFHDTSQKSLFSASVRTFSHGCMRVQNPLRLAELLLAHDRNMPRERVQALASPGAPKDNQINLNNRFPVHITYFTATVEDDGKTTYRSDIYGHEERIALALEGKTHLIAKVREPAPVKRVVSAPSYANQSGSAPPWLRNIFNF
ncbi:MAG: murein L,D-transpeptidase [Hyphomicrobiaceae bacterium]